MYGFGKLLGARFWIGVESSTLRASRKNVTFWPQMWKNLSATIDSADWLGRRRVLAYLGSGFRSLRNVGVNGSPEPNVHRKVTPHLPGSRRIRFAFRVWRWSQSSACSAIGRESAVSCADWHPQIRSERTPIAILEV